MSKFKIGDRVKINRFEYTQLEDRIGIIRAINPIVHPSQTMVSYDVDFHTCQYLYIAERWIELVEPEKVFDFRNHSITLNANMLHGLSFGTTVLLTPYQMKQLSITTRNQFSDFKTECEIRNLKLVEKPLDPKQDNAFKLDPHEFDYPRPILSEPFDISEELRERLRNITPPNLDYQRHILGIRTKPEPPKNRIPDRVVFNQDKGKVTVLISKFNDGEAPYRSYTSKVHGDDEYSGYFGFFLSYYKYLNRHLDGATRKELIDMAFEHGEHKEYIIEGAVSQEVLKLVKLDEWDNILDAILDVSKQKKGYWDYAEWKEMLRVHELETKREKQREVQKEIKAHEKEIEKLKQKKEV